MLLYKARIVNNVQVHEYEVDGNNLVNTITGAMVDNDDTFVETEVLAVEQLLERIKQQIQQVGKDASSRDVVIKGVANKRIKQYQKYVQLCNAWIQKAKEDGWYGN